MATQQADLTYAVVGGTQTEMKIDPNIAANPAYEAVKCDQEDHTYDVVSEGVASRQRRGNWHTTFISACIFKLINTQALTVHKKFICVVFKCEI